MFTSPRWKRRLQLASSKSIQSVESAPHFAGAQGPLAVKRAHKVLGRTLSLSRVAIGTAGHEIAVRVAPGACQRHHVVEAPLALDHPAQTIKAHAAFAV